MRAIVIGYGSIGQRHARLLDELGLEIAVISRRDVDHPNAFKSLDAALRAGPADYAVVASATSEHHSDLTALATLGFTKHVLVEKPIFEPGQKIPDNQFKSLNVAYNLRFHPVFQALSARMKDRQILQIHAYVGQYLPNWRPGTDYRESYSASPARGGGVLLDLSHDIDLLTALAGRWTGIAALGGQLSELEIESDDVASLLLRHENCPASTLALNYLDRRARREIIVNCVGGSFKADFVAATLEENGEVETFEVERDTTYRAMHEAALSGGEGLCSPMIAMDILEAIEAARTSLDSPNWIERA